MQKFVFYFSHNSLPIAMEEFFQKKLKESCNNIPIISVMKSQRSDYSKSFADINIIVDYKANNWKSILFQMDTGISKILEIEKDSIVYLCEHDVLYPSSYFLNEPDNDLQFLKNTNLYFINKYGFLGPYNDIIHSQTIGSAKLFKHCIHEDTVNYFKTRNGYTLKRFNNIDPCIDVRHGYNYTGPRYANKNKNYIHYLSPWGNHEDLIKSIPEIKKFRQDPD